MSAAELQRLSAAIAALPPSVNPYAYVTEVFHRQVAPKPAQFFIYVIDVYFALGSCALLFGIIAVACKVYIGSAWLFRRKPVDGGFLILPNTSLILAVLASFWAFVLIIDCHFLLAGYNAHHSIVPVQGLQGVTWLPMLFMGWSEAWGMAVSSYLSRHNRSRKQRSSTFNHLAHKVKPASLPPTLINAFFLLGYLVQAAVIIPMFGKATVNLRRAWDALMDLQKTLAVPSAAWQPGQAFQLDPAWLPIVVRLEADGEDAVIAISHGFAAYVALMAVLLLVFFPTALAYIRMLRTQIRDYINSLSQVTDTQQFVRIHQLRGTYRLMITEAVLVFTVGAILLAEAIWMAIDHTVLRDGHKFLVVWAICLWTAGLLIAPLNVILCFRAFRPIWIARKSQHSNRALMSAIQVETIIERFAEGDMEDKEDMVNLDQRSPAMVSFNTVKHDSMDKI